VAAGTAGCVTIPFYSSRLGGRPIGRTPDSESGYPGSSPGLPAKYLVEPAEFGCANPSLIWATNSATCYELSKIGQLNVKQPLPRRSIEAILLIQIDRRMTEILVLGAE
jgi:hypothetical protein